jgi:hypothetical protein
MLVAKQVLRGARFVLAFPRSLPQNKGEPRTMGYQEILP